MTRQIQAVNDFVVKFANVNGSGSASANGLFGKAILRMGVAVAARNIFPSNTQGLPTRRYCGPALKEQIVRGVSARAPLQNMYAALAAVDVPDPFSFQHPVTGPPAPPPVLRTTT